MRADLRTLVRIETALKKVAHNTGLNELPVCFDRSSERTHLFFVQLKNSGFFKKMTVEMPNLVRAETTACRHRREQFLERFGEMLRIIDARFENLGDKICRKQPCVFGEEAKDDAV